MTSSTTNSEKDLSAIRQQLSEQSTELNELRRELKSMRTNGNGNHQPNGSSFLDAAQSNNLTDRRSMLKKVAGIAAGVATVGLLRPSNSTAAINRPKTIGARSATGDPGVLGQTNTTDDTTELHNASLSLSDLQVEVQNYGNVAFAQPGGTNIAIVGYANTAGAPAGNTNTIIGVWGEGRGGSGGAGGRFVGDDTGVIVEAGRATFCIFSTDETFPPTTAGFHNFGEVIVSQDYTMWWSFSTPTAYRRLAGPALTANDLPTAGALSLLKAPKRLVDTRTGSGFFDAGNHLGSNDLRTYNIVGLAGASFLPPVISAIVGRITVANATGPGGLQESPNPPPVAGNNDLGFGTAVLSYPSAATIPSFGATFISAVSGSTDPAGAGRIRIHNVMGPGQTADVIIDITGYYI